MKPAEKQESQHRTTFAVKAVGTSLVHIYMYVYVFVYVYIILISANKLRLRS